MNGIPAIPEESWKTIVAHAERDYPAECCGLILGRAARFTRVRPCTNAQTKFHRLDPENFPRTELNAYFIEPRELLELQKEIRETGEMILGIYHSHPDAEPYFSVEDQERAVVNGEAVYPGAAYLVMSVQAGRVLGHQWFAWDGSSYVSVSD